MRPGPLIRGLFGPYERVITEAYRGLFVDLDDFAGRLQVWVPQPRRILEVGCGEGAMTERLSRAYPAATVTGIDITPKIGRLFRGDAARVEFFRKSVEDVARDEPASFDLVVLCDVVHHVPLVERQPLLSAVGRAISAEGSLVIKDWIVSTTPIHWLCNFSIVILPGTMCNFARRQARERS
jgi:2-polyprenyl-3-methyl-5-hydroxy-6-metoxy-1,4-benzoquinol methylase